MGQKRSPGLYLRGGFWFVDKQIQGRRIRESTGTGDLREAEAYLAKKVEDLRQATIYGVRPKRLFCEAAEKFLLENRHLSSLRCYGHALHVLMGFIGELPLESVHMGTLQGYIEARQREGVKNRTINLGLQVTRRILNLAAGTWLDDNGLTWIPSAPRIKLLAQGDARQPKPLDWEEQEKLLAELPEHLKTMVLFKVNTGLRERNVCRLQWNWEVKLPTMNSSVFVIPGDLVKNRQPRLVILNEVARQIVEAQRGKHPTNVFVYNGKPILRINNSAWKRARKRLGMKFRVHDLKHTFGRRLRTAGVSLEDRQDLLGHKSDRITTHYSAAEVSSLIKAANTVCEKKDDPTLTILELLSQAGGNSTKSPQEQNVY